MDEEEGIEIQLVNSICEEEEVGREIQLGEKVERSIREDLERRSEDRASHTIFTVPDFVRSGEKETHYSPIVISIGPYHRDPSNFEATEDHKRSFLKDLLSRYDKEKGRKLTDCVEAIVNLEEQARRCYEKKIELNRDEFAKVLFRDGCFIIELLYKFYSGEDGYMLSGSWSGRLVWIDLLKLENQIPFFVLEKLYQILLDPKIREKDDSFVCKEKHPLRVLALVYLTQLRTQFQPKRYRKKAEDTEEVHHLLHLYYLYHMSFVERGWRFPSLSGGFCPNLCDTLASLFSLHKRIRRVYIHAKRSVGFTVSRRQTGKSPIKVKCATQLEEDGVKFIKKKKPGNFYDIEFDKRRGLMKIPQLQVTMETMTLSLNLIAYEEIKCPNKDLISFAFLMDCLIDSPNDVAVLRKHDIIVSDLEDKTLTMFFNQLCKSCNLTIKYYTLTNLSNEVNDYCEFRLLRGRTHLRKLKHDYFSNPWALISFLAAAILLGLTIVQTIFSILSYIQPRS